MAEPDLCDLIANSETEEKKAVSRDRQERFSDVEEKVTYIIEQNYKPKGLYYGDLDPVECCLLDTFTDEKIIRMARINANSSDDAIKKTVLFDALISLTGVKSQNYDISRMSMKQFSQYFALSLIYSSMQSLLDNPEESSENLFERLTSGNQGSQIKKDKFYEFRRPNPVCELVATKYLSLFRYKNTRESAIHASNIHDLKYLLVADIYNFGLKKDVQQKTMSYIEQGENKKAAVYAVLQSIKDELFF